MVYVKAYRRKGKRRVVAVRRHNRSTAYQWWFYPKKTIINITHQAVVFRDSSGNWSVKIGTKMLPDAFEDKQDAIDYAETYDSA